VPFERQIRKHIILKVLIPSIMSLNKYDQNWSACELWLV